MGDTRQIAAEFVEAFNAHDADGIRRLCAEDVVLEAPGDLRRGGEAATQFALVWMNAFPDTRDGAQRGRRRRVAVYSMKYGGGQLPPV